MRVLRSSCVLAWFVAHGALAALEPAELLTRIRGSTLVPADAVALRNVKLELGPAIFEMQRGILFPAAPVAGRTVELVFIGQARFLLDAPDEIEAGQLELFTGERSLEAPVEEAVLVLANDEAVAELLRGPPPHEVRPELKARAEDIHRRWLERAERRLAGVESAIFKLLIGDEAFQQYFALWCHSFEPQNPWLIRGVDPTLKSGRLANYVVNLRKEILGLSRACGVVHPALVTADQLELLDGRFGSKTLATFFEYGSDYGLPSD